MLTTCQQVAPGEIYVKKIFKNICSQQPTNKQAKYFFISFKENQGSHTWITNKGMKSTHVRDSQSKHMQQHTQLCYKHYSNFLSIMNLFTSSVTLCFDVMWCAWCQLPSLWIPFPFEFHGSLSVVLIRVLIMVCPGRRICLLNLGGGGVLSLPRRLSTAV